MCNHARCHATGHDPIQCIIPPHMLKTMEMRGDAKVSAMARSLLKKDVKLREARVKECQAGMVGDPNAGPGGFVATSAVAARAAPTRNLDREVFDGEGKAALPGRLARGEGDCPTGDKDVDAAYDGAGDVYELYYNEFNRDSLDGRGMKLKATVNHRRGYNNAFWNGTQMVYGDGDGRIFRTFTELSVIGHEMSHGLVQFSGGLVYQGQSGALNESVADVFGAMTVQKKQDQSVYEANWLIGEDILGEDINGVALRSMKMPGTAYSDALLGQDPQPYHMSFYDNTTADNGGVHINSGIPNHAFYLYCMYLGGSSWGAPGQVWYHALQRLNNPNATFFNWAERTVASAVELYGIGTPELMSLRRAWTLVGLQI